MPPGAPHLPPVGQPPIPLAPKKDGGPVLAQVLLMVRPEWRGSGDMAIDTLGAALRQINRLFAGGVVTGFSDAQLLERFAANQDPAAFGAPGRRAGPRGLGVC